MQRNIFKLNHPKLLASGLGQLLVVPLLLVLLTGCDQKGQTFVRYAAEASPVLGVVVDQNLTVLGVDASSAAEKAGIKVGDKLKKLDAVAVASTTDAKQKVREKAKKDKVEERKVTVTLDRNNKELTLDATLTAPTGRAGQPTVTPVPTNQDYF